MSTYIRRISDGQILGTMDFPHAIATTLEVDDMNDLVECLEQITGEAWEVYDESSFGVGGGIVGAMAGVIVGTPTPPPSTGNTQHPPA